MTVDYSTLALGQEISNRMIRVDAHTVTKYVGAVDDATARPGGPGEAKAPPMAVAALGAAGRAWMTWASRAGPFMPGRSSGSRALWTWTRA